MYLFTDIGMTQIIPIHGDIIDRVGDAIGGEKNKDLYGQLFESARDAMLIMDGAAVVDCNPAALALFGCSAEDLDGPFPVRFSPRFQPDGRLSQMAAKERFNRALAGKPQFFFWRHLKKNGQPVETEISLNRIDLGGAPGLCAVIRDVTPRIRTEEQVQSSERLYRGLFNSMAEGVAIYQMVYGPDRRAEDAIIEEVNPAFEQIAGLSREQAVGQRLSVLMKTEKRLNLEIVAQVVETGRPAFYETQLPLLGKQLSVSAFALGPGQFVTVFSDITQAKKTEAELARHRIFLEVLLGKRDLQLAEANEQIQAEVDQRLAAEVSLKESEERYRSVVEHSGAGLIIVEEDMTISMINPELEELLGYSKEEAEGRMSWPQLIHPEDLEKMKANHSERRRAGKDVPSEYDCRVVDREGRIHHMHIKVGLLPDGRRSIGSLIDLTDRVRAEKSLQHSQAQLSDIIDASAGHIYTVDTDCRLRFLNKALMNSLGRDARGEFCYQVFHHRDNPCDNCPSKEVFQGEPINVEVKSSSMGKWFYTLQNPVFDDYGRVVQKQVVAIDITDRKQAEEEMREKEGLLLEENHRLRANMKDRYRFGNIVGKSPAMQEVYDLVLKAAGTGANAIVTGESGTGKELVARAIHDMSPRRDMPFVPVNCGAIPEHLLESEFFGYKKGAFTGAVSDKNGFLDTADGGTLFLDEVGEIGLGMQVKLLRAVEGGGFTPVGGQRPKKPNVRIIAATNRDLEELVETGAMREDFYYRIHVIPIQLPPLRQRKEDLPLLIEHFLEKLEKDQTVPSVTGKILEKFYRYHWPGNVRELENVLSRYATLKRVDFNERPARPTALRTPVFNASFSHESAGDLKQAVEAFEKAMIQRTLDDNRWQKAKTATLLGIHRKTLFTKMKQYDLAES